MTAVDVVRGALPQAAGDSDMGHDAERQCAAASFAKALVALVADARACRVSATAPGERWLILRIDEALRGFADIQEMAADDEPAPRTCGAGLSTTGVVPGTTGATLSAGRVKPSLGCPSDPSST